MAEILSRVAAELALFAGVGFLLFAINDLLVDLLYFARLTWRAFAIYTRYPRAFASDRLALATTKRAMARGFDQQVPAAWRLFYYLPFEHSEVLDDQQRGLDLLMALPQVPGRRTDPHMSRLHLEIIERFGRFPHRNPILGRHSTVEELTFLAECEHRFGQPSPDRPPADLPQEPPCRSSTSP